MDSARKSAKNLDKRLASTSGFKKAKKALFEEESRDSPIKLQIDQMDSPLLNVGSSRHEFDRKLR